MVAAGIRALFVDGAQAGFTIEVVAVVIAHAGQGKDARLLMETFDDAVFLQALGDVLQRLAAFELINHTDTDQVIQPRFDWQRAAAGHAAVAHVCGVFGPGFQAVEFGGGNQVVFHRGWRQVCGAR